MKLSDIVRLKNMCQQFDADYSDQTTHYVNTFVASIKEQALRFNEHFADIDQRLNDVHTSLDNFVLGIDNLIQLIDQTIVQREPELLQQSHDLWHAAPLCETNEYILNRQLISDSPCYELLLNRCKNLADWRWPGMIIRPARHEIVKDLVALDPLYLVDHNESLLEPCVSQFHPVYQRRLRCYTVNDWQGQPFFTKLPTQQFGFVLVYNFFNYKTLEVCQQYLSELWNLLRPGGTLIFSYNNCDWAANVILAENNYMCYTPGRLLLSHVRDIGYEIVEQQTDHGALHWVSVRRPGTMTTIRAAQTLAKIIAQP